MSTGTYRQFPVYAEDETGFSDSDAAEPIVDGEAVSATIFNRPIDNLRLRTEKVRGAIEDLAYLADADRALIVAGPGKVTWPGSVTAGASGIFVLSDVLYVIPALTRGGVQVSPVPPTASSFGTLSLDRATGSSAAILVTSLLRDFQGGHKLNITVVSGTVYSCVLADEETMSIVITATASTDLTTIINSLNALVNANTDNICTAALQGGALGADLIERPQSIRRQTGNHDAEAHAITPAQLAAFFAIGGNPLLEGDSLCVQYSTLIDTSPATDGGRRQSIPENSNTSVLTASLFNSRVSPDRLVNAIPVCKVVDGRLCFISGQQIFAGAIAVDLGGGVGSVALTDIMSSVVMNDGSLEFSQGAHAGLTFSVNGGTYWMNGIKTTKAVDTTLLADATTNYVYIDTDGDLKDTTSASTATTLPRLVLYKAVTAGGAITTITDLRRFHTRFNSRKFITVGTYGDFQMLENAVAWVVMMRSVGEDSPLEIVIQGDVTMTSQIVLTDSVTIRANEPGQGHINTPSGVAAFSVQSGTVDDVIFENIRFNVPTAVGSGLIDIGGTAACNTWELNRCRINGGRGVHAIEVISTAAHNGWRIRDCEFFGMAHTAITLSIALEQMSNAVISGNKITGGLGDAFDAGIFVGYDSHNNCIEKNHIETGGIAIAVSDDNLASSLTAVCTGNQVSNNYVTGAFNTNAVQICGETLLEGNHVSACDPGSSTNGVVSVWGNGGPVVIQNNHILNWAQGAAIEFNDDFYSSLVANNVLRTTLETADFGLYDVTSNLGPMTVVGNIIDLSGAAVPAGSPSGVAVGLNARQGVSVSGNMFRGVGTVGLPSAGIIALGANASIVGNIFNHCYGVPYAVGTTPVIAGNQGNSGGSTNADVSRLDNAGAVCHYGFQRSEALATLTTASITLNQNCSTLFVACPGGTTHVIGGFTGGRKGRRIEVWNTGTTTVDIGHEDGLIGTATDRIHCSGTADITVPAKSCVVVTYDDDISRWRAARLT